MVQHQKGHRANRDAKPEHESEQIRLEKGFRRQNEAQNAQNETNARENRRLGVQYRQTRPKQVVDALVSARSDEFDGAIPAVMFWRMFFDKRCHNKSLISRQSAARNAKFLPQTRQTGDAMRNQLKQNTENSFQHRFSPN
jgi:hypothetical protein